MQHMKQNFIPENQDPFIILKNHRKKLIRPKAKYVRKAPYFKKNATKPQVEHLDLLK